MPTPSLLVVRESGHGAAATRSGVDDQYASRHSAWLHCPARDCRRSRRVVRGLAVRAAAASARAWAVSPGADHMAIAKPSSSPPRSRSRRRSPPTRGGRSRPAGPSTAEANVPARASELAQYAADGVPRARSHLTAARTKERFFASQVTARGPIVAPWNTPTVPTLQQPDPRKLLKCSEFLDSGEWAIQDSNLGPLPYQENLLSPPVPPSHLIPANLRDGASGRGLERTGRGQPGGPVVAPRPPFEGMVSYDPVAVIMPTIRSSPDAPEAGRCAPARSRRPRRASVRGRARPSRDRGCRGGPATVTELARDIQPSACHAASTASLAFRPRRRRGCEETGAAGNELMASQPLRASREIRGERPT